MESKQENIHPGKPSYKHHQGENPHFMAGLRMLATQRQGGRDLHWRDDSMSSSEEIYVVLDLTSDEEASRTFTERIFPYEQGDACIHLDVKQAQAVLRLRRCAATNRQNAVLKLTSAVVGYVFKEREEVIQRFPSLFATPSDEERQFTRARRGVTH